MESRHRVDVRERADGYQESCAVCGRPRATIRARLWWPPDHDPRGVPAWRVEVHHYCSEHRAEAHRLDTDPA